MRKAFAILLLIAHLTASTEAHELMKLPFMATHLQEHSQDAIGQDFLTFLFQHYVGAHGAEPGHQQLPFSAHKDACMTAKPVVTPLALPLVLPHAETEPRVFTPSSQVLNPSQHIQEIWQPPKA